MYIFRGLKMSDNWCTPDWLFEKLSKEHGSFDIDLCATAENSKCQTYGSNYLRDEYGDLQQGENAYIGAANNIKDIAYLFNMDLNCFMNPPYSNPLPFIEKAWEDSKHCKIVCLVKADPSTKWWAVFWNYKEVHNCHCFDSDCPFYESIGPKPGCTVQFFPKRIQFDPPIELVNSGEVWNLEFGCEDSFKNPRWVQKCKSCHEGVIIYGRFMGGHDDYPCEKCNGKGYKPFSGLSFPSALLIFDRRGV
jgi:phage N-6-adenine-methyltransferase